MTLMEQHGACRRVLPIWSLLSRLALAIVIGFLLFPRSPQGSAREPSASLRAESDAVMEGALRGLGRALTERQHQIERSAHLDATDSVEPRLRLSPTVPVLLAQVAVFEASATYREGDVTPLFDPRPLGPLARLQHGLPGAPTAEIRAPPALAHLSKEGTKEAGSPHPRPPSRRERLPVFPGPDMEAQELQSGSHEKFPGAVAGILSSPPETRGHSAQKGQGASKNRSSERRAQPVPPALQKPWLDRGLLQPEVTGSTVGGRALGQEDPERRCAYDYEGKGPYGSGGQKPRVTTCVLRVRG
jgi:hypothetical protein